MNIKRGILNRASSKGQITIFIIIGIVILFSSAAIFYFVKTSSTQRVESEVEAVIANVPQTFQPIQSYTENCLYQIGKQGLLILGQQGGYIYPDLLGEYSPSEPTESVGLNLDPTKVPYWLYNPEANDARKVTHASKKPKLYFKDDPELSIEAQLSRFVSEKIESCLDNYHSFESQGFRFKSIENAPREVTVKVGGETITLLLKMDVEARKGDSATTLNSFLSKIQCCGRVDYVVAEKITNTQQNYSFIEKQGLELISIYSRKDPNSFAPTSDIGFELISVLSWSESVLKEKFKTLLSSYLPMLRYLGSSNFYYKVYPEGNLQAQRLTDNAILPLTGAEDLEVSFDYYGWPIYFSTNSDANGIIRPEHQAVKWQVLNFAHQRYETHYDASYPVLVTLHDASAFGGEGFDFLFALEANIRNNAPAEAGTVRETYPQKISPLACNEEQRNSALIKTVVVDSFTKEPIETVKIGFTIPEQDECEIGITNKQGELESSYPTVYGGVVNFVKPEYLTNYYPLDTYKYRSEPVALGQAIAGAAEGQRAIELHRIKKINVSVQLKELEKCLTPLECKYTVSPVIITATFLPFAEITCQEISEQCFFNQGNNVLLGDPLIQLEANGSLAKYHKYYFTNKARPPQENEEFFINLERVSGFQENVFGEDFFATIGVKGNEIKEVNLVPGKYKVTGITTLNQKILIAKEERCIDYHVLTVEKQQCFKMDESNMDLYVSGNLNWNTPETYFVITPDQLYSSSHLTITLPVQDLSSVPVTIPSTQYECVGYLCLPGVGCGFDACKPKTVQINSRVIEDLTIPGEIEKISRRQEIRSALEPQFSVS